MPLAPNSSASPPYLSIQASMLHSPTTLPATALKGVGMLGAPHLSQTPTDVSQRSFGGVLQRGVGTPHTASSVRNYTITTN